MPFPPLSHTRIPIPTPISTPTPHPLPWILRLFKGEGWQVV